MKAFEVHLNGRKLCTAGFTEHDVVLNAIVDYVSGNSREELALTVGGLISSKQEYVHWVKRKKLRIGDEMRIKIIETEFADSPQERRSREGVWSAPKLTQQKQYVREMAKRFGWKITTGHSRVSKKKR